MKHFNKDVELAIDFAANEISKAVADTYSADYQRVRKNVRAMICAAVSGSCNDAGWASGSNIDPWLRSAADPPGGLDRAAFSNALNKWWDALDDKGKLGVVLGPAGHHKSEFVNNLLQKYQDKPEAVLLKDLPDLQRAYRAELGGGQTPTPAPAPAAVPEEQPVQEEVPGA